MAFLINNPILLAVAAMTIGFGLALLLASGRGSELRELRRARDEWEGDRLALLSSFNALKNRAEPGADAAPRAAGLPPETAARLDELEAHLKTLARDLDDMANADAAVEAALATAEAALSARGATEAPDADFDAAAEQEGEANADADPARAGDAARDADAAEEEPDDAKAALASAKAAATTQRAGLGGWLKNSGLGAFRGSRG